MPDYQHMIVSFALRDIPEFVTGDRVRTNRANVKVAGRKPLREKHLPGLQVFREKIAMRAREQSAFAAESRRSSPLGEGAGHQDIFSNQHAELPKWQRQSQAAFTLVELLVVIAIITILAGLLLPALAKARDAAWISACASNMRQIAQATINYASDWNDFVTVRPESTLGASSRLVYFPYDGGGNARPAYGFKFFTENYLGIPLEYAGDVYARPKSNSKTILYCPASKTPNHSLYAYDRYRYIKVTYTLWNYQEFQSSAGKCPRLAKLCRPTRAPNCSGYRKILFGDIYSTFVGAGSLGITYYNWNHDLHGANYAYPDSHVRWEPSQNMVEVGPNKYYLPRATAAQRLDGQIFLWNGADYILYGDSQADMELY